SSSTSAPADPYLSHDSRRRRSFEVNMGVRKLDMELWSYLAGGPRRTRKRLVFWQDKATESDIRLAAEMQQRWRPSDSDARILGCEEALMAAIWEAGRFTFRFTHAYRSQIFLIAARALI